MLAGCGVGPLARGREGWSSAIGPVVVGVQGPTVFYQPQLSVPGKEVGVARRVIHVLPERVEPLDARGERRRGSAREGIEAQRARRVVERQVQAAARLQEIL